MSTDWINITIEDLYTYLAAPQVEALRRCALAKSQQDPVEDAIHNTALNIRAHIASNKRNALSQQPYAIPPELKSEACVLALEIAQLRIPGLKLTSDQSHLADQARSKLQKVVSGEIVISLPNDRIAGREKAIEVVAYRPHFVTGQTMKGF